MALEARDGTVDRNDGTAVRDGISIPGPSADEGWTADRDGAAVQSRSTDGDGTAARDGGVVDWSAADARDVTAAADGTGADGRRETASGADRPGSARDVAAVGDRVESLLGQLADSSDPKAAAASEEMVRSLLELYGAGLARIVEIADAQALIGDPLVEALLLVHDLHPYDAGTRIQRALDEVRPYLGSHSGGVDYLGIDDDGVVHLRLEGSCNGCAASSATARGLLETAVQEAAPETAGVEIAGVADEPKQALLQIGTRPRYAACPPIPAAMR